MDGHTLVCFGVWCCFTAIIQVLRDRLEEMRWELAAFGRLAHARYGSQWHADTAVFVASKATSGFGCLKMETHKIHAGKKHHGICGF